MLTGLDVDFFQPRDLFAQFEQSLVMGVLLVRIGFELGFQVVYVCLRSVELSRMVKATCFARRVVLCQLSYASPKLSHV